MRRFLIPAVLAVTAASLSAETLVAVGYGGRRMTSTDGRAWENVQQWADKGADDWNNLISICYGKGKFVCVGGGGWSRDTQAGHILVSTDGKDWREVEKQQFRVSPIVFDGTRFIAGGPNHKLLRSDDGEKWTAGADIALPADVPGWAFWFRRGVTGSGISIFMGNAGPKQATWWTLATKDGGSVVNFTTEVPKSEGLAFGAGRFVSASKTGLVASVDGVKWVPVTGAPEDEFRGLIWTGQRFFLTGKKGSYVSPDGLTWTAFAKAPPCNVVFSNEKLWIGTGWPGNMFASKDGKSWEKTGQPLPAMGVNGVATDAR